uniref:Uncharacterized protein n=1 Tax=Setaria digitata TaxID=48799 RepID=A0A915PYK2_9BILA
MGRLRYLQRIPECDVRVVIVVVNGMVLVGPCSIPFPFGSAGLGIGDRHPSPAGRRPPPTSFQTFHFAEGHEPPQNESHGEGTEGRGTATTLSGSSSVVRNPNTIKRSLNESSPSSRPSTTFPSCCTLNERRLQFIPSAASYESGSAQFRNRARASQLLLRLRNHNCTLNTA